MKTDVAAGKKAPVILVTGSSRGIGRGIALSLAHEGYSVAINYAGNREAAEKTKADCEATAIEAATIGVEQNFAVFQADIGKKEDRERMLGEVLDDFGKVDGLVNNAGIAPRLRADITEASEESFEELLRVNLQGPYFLTQKVVRYWLGLDAVRHAAGGPSSGVGGGGQRLSESGSMSSGVRLPLSDLPGGQKIIFISSISADSASTSRGDYCISKAGIGMAVKLWAARLAAEGIQVYEIRPGIMATDMTAGVKEKYDRLIGEGLVPQRRWGEAEDVGKAVTAMLRGDFLFSTGSVIYSDGGFHISRL